MKINWTYIIGGLVVIILAFFLGWFARPSDKPITIVTETVKYDTLKTEKFIDREITKTIIKTDTVYQDKAVTVYTDSLQGSENEVEYNIKHTIEDGDSVRSIWDLQIKNLVTTINQYTVKDSVQTILEYKYVSKPFFLNEWFWVSLVELVGIILIAVMAVL